MKLLNKFITRKNNNVETYYYHYDLVIWKKTRHVMLFRNEIMLYDRQFFEDDSFDKFRESEERSLIQLCIKHSDVISYSKTVFFDR